MIVTDSRPVIELCESETSARIADVKSSSCILEFENFDGLKKLVK